MNIEENVASALCYVGWWVTGLIFYLMEKENKTVRFHAMQSLMIFIGVCIILVMLNVIALFIPFMWILSTLFGLLVFILWLVLIIKSYQGEKFKLPIVGDIAEKQVK